jgi:proteasome lid subunit RPN8/RPN11
MTRVALPESLRAQILEEARKALPGECCGLVEGVRLGEELRITALHPARNLATAPDRFELAPEDHFRAFKAARANQHVLIGCYHSHPNGKAEPSPIDQAGAGEEEFLWLIAAGERLEAFVYLGGEFRAAAWAAA